MLPPDVNTAQTDFAVDEGKIRFGLNAVKRVGENAVTAILRARDEGGPFESIWDFTGGSTQEVNKRALESLVRAGRSTPPAPRGWGCSACSSRRSRGAEARGRPPRRAGVDLRHGRRRGGAEPRHHPPVPTAEFGKPSF